MITRASLERGIINEIGYSIDPANQGWVIRSLRVKDHMRVIVSAVHGTGYRISRHV